MKNHFTARAASLFFACMAFVLSMKAQVVVINEYSASNLSQYLDNHSDYNDWIELYNVTASTVNLAGYYLSDDSLNNLKWQIPSGITISGYGFKRFWASGRNIVEGTSYHTNFKLKQTKNTKEFVVLSDQFGDIVDYVQMKKTQLGHSRGRTTNGASAWGIFTTPTPNASNNTSTAYTRYADNPVFSWPAGYYPGTISVTITTTDSNATIRYTTDGTLPTTSSTIYSSPVSITTTKVLKAITYTTNTGVLPSYIEFNTYFININHTLPVVSIAATQLTSLANGNGNLYPVGSFEYFNLSKIRTATTYGQFNKHGQDSWALSQRSLDFIARDEMGYNHSVEEKLFTNTARTNFQKIILRAAGDDNFPADYNSSNLGSAHVRDAFIHNLADKGGLSLDVRRGAKCIIYLNGAYWGVYDLRENPDDHDFTDFNYGQDKFNLQYIERWGSIWSEYGGAQAQTDWNTLYDYIMNNDMSVAANYQYVTDRYEVKSLVDYFLVNMFTVCSDWLIWNTAWWRGLDSTGTHLKWGYILWDNDATFGHYINYTGIPNTNPDADPCDPETGIADSEDPDDHIGVLLKLKTNPVFYQYYISRQIDLWNTVFGCDNMLAQLDSTVALIQPEMQQHSTRWSGIYSDWVDNVQTLRDFIVDRCSLLTYGFISCYALNGPYDLTLNTTPAGAGNLRLNSLLLDSFPWTGTYFGGIETLLEAIPNSGYQFNDWNAANHTFTPNATSLNVKITSLNSDDIVIADFNQIVKTNDYPMKAQTVNVYPTIFNDEIIVVYNVLAPAPVTIKLLSPLGQEIITTTPPQSFSDKGYYSVKFNLAGTGLSPGIYLIEFTEGDYRKSVKVVKAGK